MSEKWCCVTWEALAPELRDMKEAEISQLIEDKGIPKSTFAQVFKILDGMTNCCAYCGGSSNEEAPTVQPTAKLRTPVTPKESRPTVFCAACAGTGKAGGDKRSTIKCISCHGKGMRDGSNTMSEPLTGDKQDELDNTKEQVRQKPVNAKANKPAKDQDI